MAYEPEITRTDSARVSCAGASDVAGTALGHPRIWLQIDPEIGFAECGYCDHRFVLINGPADVAAPKAAKKPAKTGMKKAGA